MLQYFLGSAKCLKMGLMFKMAPFSFFYRRQTASGLKLFLHLKTQNLMDCGDGCFKLAAKLRVKLFLLLCLNKSTVAVFPTLS